MRDLFYTEIKKCVALQKLSPECVSIKNPIELFL